MVFGFLIICVCCAFMHRILVNKGNLYLYRTEVQYNVNKKDTTGNMREGVGVVEGEVGAVSYDKFFLKLNNGKLQPILRGELELPEVGERLSVTYAGGNPPKALMIERSKAK